jgi:hypothetical protein
VRFAVPIAVKRCDFMQLLFLTLIINIFSLQAHDLAQVSFVCTECGPIQNVQVLDISTEVKKLIV